MLHLENITCMQLFALFSFNQYPKQSTMKTKILINVGAAFLLTILILYSCKKQELITNPEVFKNAVSNWQTDFVKNASALEIERVNTIINLLDYSSASQSDFEGNNVLAIKINRKTATGTQQYLVLSKQQDSYGFKGIYQASDLQTLIDFYSSNRLAGDKIIFETNITGQRGRGWQGLKSGKMINLMTFGTKNKSFNATKISELNSKVRVNSYYYNDCTRWYLIGYDEETGIIYTMTYLYSTGCDAETEPTGGGGASPTIRIVNQCGQTDDEVLAIINSVTTEPMDVALIQEGESTWDPTVGLWRIPRVVSFTFLKAKVGFSTIEWTANFTGSLTSTTGGVGTWIWETFAYSNTALTNGASPACTAFHETTTCATTIDSDKKKARCALSFTYYLVGSCASAGIQLTVPTTVSVSTAFDPTSYNVIVP